jgi:hypothetical protein
MGPVTHAETSRSGVMHTETSHECGDQSLRGHAELPKWTHTGRLVTQVRTSHVRRDRSRTVETNTRGADNTSRLYENRKDRQVKPGKWRPDVKTEEDNARIGSPKRACANISDFLLLFQGLCIRHFATMEGLLRWLGRLVQPGSRYSRS